MATNQLDGVILNNPTIVGTVSATLAATTLAARTTQLFPMPLQDARVWDAPQTPLPTTSATDDLGFIIGTFATNGVLIQTYDVKAAGAVTLYCRWPQVVVPHNYHTAQSAFIRLYAGMDTTISGGTATIDVEAYVTDGVGGVSADKVSTAAQSINSLTDANFDFDLGSTLLPGDILDIRVTVAVNDGAEVTAVIANLGRAYFGCQTR